MCTHTQHIEMRRCIYSDGGELNHNKCAVLSQARALSLVYIYISFWLRGNALLLIKIPFIYSYVVRYVVVVVAEVCPKQTRENKLTARRDIQVKIIYLYTHAPHMHGYVGFKRLYFYCVNYIMCVS